jgi:hypothetical protein
MDETQTLAAQALRELLDPDLDDWGRTPRCESRADKGDRQK